MNKAGAQTWIEPLSEREIEIVGLISEGLSNREISRELNLSVETIKWYNKQIYEKLGVSRRLQAVRKAEEMGLLGGKSAPRWRHDGPSRGNLPTPISSFVGREPEMEEIRGLLKSSRLVVLTGPGGSGKTRLALEVGRELVDAYRDGVWFVELGSISDPTLVAGSIAEDLDANVGPERAPEETVRRFLVDKHLLLILDNLEHLLEAAPLIGDLLSEAPKLSILATSRERLHISGEQEYPVQPLRAPELEADETQEDWLDYESVDLFFQRARSAQPAFSLEEGQAAAVARICAALDGLPLAIELAASQVKTIPPTVLVERLAGGLEALPTGPRDLPERQRTLRATINWSYELLKPGEKKLLVRMAVFRGGSTLKGIRYVCSQGFGGHLMNLLSGLVEKSLVIPREGPDGEIRFTMLETIRAFARERLANAGELAATRQRHAAYFAQMVTEAAAEMRSARQQYWFRRLRAEQDNLRSVLSWSLGGAVPEFGLRIAAGMMDYWYYNGRTAEGRRWTDLALKRAHGAEPALRAGVLASAGKIDHGLGDLGTAKEHLRQAVAIYRESGEERRMAWALADLGVTFMENENEIPKGILHSQEALDIQRSLGDNVGMATTCNILGELFRVEGDDKAAERYYEQSLALVEVTGERQREAILYADLCFLACHRGEYERGLALIQRSLRIIDDLENDYGFACFAGVAAGPAAGLGRWERAAHLLGASRGLYEKLGSGDQFADQIEYENTKARVREHMGERDFEAAWQGGHQLTRADILSIVFDELGE